MQALDLSKIGCSDLAAIVGVDRYNEPIDVWNRVVHGIQPPRSRWLEECGELGKMYERATAEACCRFRLGIEEPILHQPPSRQSAARPWQRYSLDFVLAKPIATEADISQQRYTRILECKIRNSRSFAAEDWGPEGSGEVPPHILTQVQGQLEAIRTDRDAWIKTTLPEIDQVDVAVSENGQQIRHWEVARDEELGGLLAQAAERFWTDHCRTGIPPPLQGSESSRRELRRRYPLRGKVWRQASEEDAKHAAEMAEVVAQMGDLEKRKLALEVALCDSIGWDYGLEGEDWTAIWYERSGRVQWKAFVKELADRAGLTDKEINDIRDSHRGEKDRVFKWQRTAKRRFRVQ